jgi:hypothetical protein
VWDGMPGEAAGKPRAERGGVCLAVPPSLGCQAAVAAARAVKNPAGIGGGERRII